MVTHSLFCEPAGLLQIAVPLFMQCEIKRRDSLVNISMASLVNCSQDIDTLGGITQIGVVAGIDLQSAFCVFEEQTAQNLLLRT